MFEILYASIPDRLAQQRPQNGFNLEDLFTVAEWTRIGDGPARQLFGQRFAAAVLRGTVAGVTRNEQPNNPGGNEARYDYSPVE